MHVRKPTSGTPSHRVQARMLKGKTTSMIEVKPTLADGLKVCPICSGDRGDDPRQVVHRLTATQKDDGCPYRKKSDPASRAVEVRKICGRTGYRIFDGSAPIEHFDYFRNAMRLAKRFAKALDKDSVCYVRMCPYGCCPERRVVAAPLEPRSSPEVPPNDSELAGALRTPRPFGELSPSDYGRLAEAAKSEGASKDWCDAHGCLRLSCTLRGLHRVGEPLDEDDDSESGP